VRPNVISGVEGGRDTRRKRYAENADVTSWESAQARLIRGAECVFIVSTHNNNRLPDRKANTQGAHRREARGAARKGKGNAERETMHTPRPARNTVLAIAVSAPADPRTVEKVLRRERTQVAVRDRIHRAIVNLGLADLLAQPMTDPDAAEDLSR
jgi:hypothetical protein